MDIPVNEMENPVHVLLFTCVPRMMHTASNFPSPRLDGGENLLPDGRFKSLAGRFANEEFGANTFVQ